MRHDYNAVEVKNKKKNESYVFQIERNYEACLIGRTADSHN